MNSELQHLPPGVVTYLDALGRKGGDPRSLHADFLAHLDMVGEWLANLSDYTIDDLEVDLFANVRAMLESVRSTAEEVNWGEQLPLLRRDLYPMFATMDRINKRREISTYSAQLAVNDFILCGVAYLQKRAPWSALEPRLDKLEHYVNNLESGLEELEHRIKPEIAEGVRVALDAMRDVLDALTPGQSDEHVKSALGSLAESAQIVQMLLDWKRQDGERFRQAHTRFLVPAAGPALESFLEFVDARPRSDWGPAVEGLLSEFLPAMHYEWLAIRRRLFSEPDQREAVWAEIENAMDDLVAATRDLLDERTSEEDALNQFEEAAEQLSGQFKNLRELTMAYAHLYGSEPGQLLEGIFGALGGTVPVVRLLELPAPDQVARDLQAYAADGDWDHLFRAGFALLSLYPAPPPVQEEPERPTWICLFCKASNEMGEWSCQGCGAAAPLSASAVVKAK
ncbi:MAG: hypothetical protein U0931_06835 [Vulcanimicrobiota bacterium]